MVVVGVYFEKTNSAFFRLLMDPGAFLIVTNGKTSGRELFACSLACNDQCRGARYCVYEEKMYARPRKMI